MSSSPQLAVHVQACARLLLEPGQAGRVLGQAGRDIAQLRQDTGAIVRVLERHDPNFPTCAGAADGALQVLPPLSPHSPGMASAARPQKLAAGLCEFALQSNAWASDC